MVPSHESTLQARYHRLRVVDGASSWTPSDGDVLAGRYRLVRCIGRGGMGSVWEAEHLTLGSRVAIKLIDAARIHDESVRGRFIREAKAAASIQSPYVVTIFDYGTDGDIPYIAMELLTGETLADELVSHGPLDPHTTLHVLEPIFRGVAKAHDAGVVHRDIKPENIFLIEGDTTPSAKLIDFGIAKGMPKGALEASTAAGTMLGTPAYMSAEQLMDAGLVDTRSDLWSLAVITYECLVGERPFKGESVGQLAVALLTTDPPVPSMHASVPSGFDAWFAKGVERDVEARFQSALAMFEALECILDEHRTKSVGSSSWKRRIVAFVAAIMVGGMGTAWGIMQVQQPDKRVPRPLDESFQPEMTTLESASVSHPAPEPARPPTGDTMGQPSPSGDATSHHDAWSPSLPQTHDPQMQGSATPDLASRAGSQQAKGRGDGSSDNRRRNGFRHQQDSNAQASSRPRSDAPVKSQQLRFDADEVEW